MLGHSSMMEPYQSSPHHSPTSFITNAAHLLPTGTEPPRHGRPAKINKKNCLARLPHPGEAYVWFQYSLCSIFARSPVPPLLPSPKRSSGIAGHGASISQLYQLPNFLKPAPRFQNPTLHPKKYAGQSWPAAALPSPGYHTVCSSCPRSS
jgi:hypothetical protein